MVCELNSDVELFTHCREKLYNLSNYNRIIGYKCTK